MRNLIFAPETINIAETTRMIEVAKHCTGFFNPIFFGYSDKFSYLIERAGFEFRKMEPWLTEEEIEHLWKVDRMEKWADPFPEWYLAKRVENEIALFNEISPVAVVTGFTLSTTISTRAAKISFVYIMPFSYTRPFFESKTAEIPEMAENLLKLVPNKWSKSIINWWGLHTKIWVKPFIKVACKYGLNHIKVLMDIFEGDYNLVASAQELTGVEKLPKDWNYIGPIFAKLDGEIPEEIMNIPRDKPLIYFSMGSSANKDILINVLRSFNTMPYHVICPMKFHLNDEKIEVPDNVYLFDWLPAHIVNSMVDLAVLHGGEGTVQTACYSGKPFIGIGLQPEQEANIEYCVKYGNAVRIKRKDISVEKLSNMIENVLSDSQMKERAVEIKNVLSNYDGSKNAANFIIKNFSV